MTQRKSLLFILPIIGLVLMACQISTPQINQTMVSPSGNTITEERSVQDVQRVSLNAVGELVIQQGESEGLTIEADSNIMPYLETKMNGSTLEIGIKPHVSMSMIPKIRYTLRVKSLEQISVAGAGNITSEALHVDKLSLDVSGAGNVRISDLQATSLKAKSSGTGNFEIKGKVTSQDVTVTGAGNFSAGDLECQTANLTITGAGNMKVWVTQTLDVNISGFGTVNYYGKPNVSQKISGAGSVKSLGERP